MRPFVSLIQVFPLALSIVLAGARTEAALVEEWSAGRQTYLLLRVLGYDDSVLKRSPTELEIAVLFNQRNVQSQAAAAQVAAALSDSEGTVIEGRALRVRLVAIDTNQPIAASLKRNSSSVYYVCEGLEAEVGAITFISRQRKVLTVAGNEGMVQAGVTLGILRGKAGQSPILINLHASREEGTRFRGDLLRIARILRHGI